MCMCEREREMEGTELPCPAFGEAETTRVFRREEKRISPWEEQHKQERRIEIKRKAGVAAIDTWAVELLSDKNNIPKKAWEVKSERWLWKMVELGLPFIQFKAKTAAEKMEKVNCPSCLAWEI